MPVPKAFATATLETVGNRREFADSNVWQAANTGRDTTTSLPHPVVMPIPYRQVVH
jgi:hypothetical protein